MDWRVLTQDQPGTAEPDEAVRCADVDAWDDEAAARLANILGQGPFGMLLLFIPPDVDGEKVARHLSDIYPATEIAGCTTAGEITGAGYAEGRLVAVALRAQYFAAKTLLVPDMHDLDCLGLIHRMIRGRQELALERPNWEYEFAFLLCDGTTMREDELMAALAPGLGPLPLFGGSAGDGVRFERSFILYRGALLRNAALLVTVRTACPVKVFSIDHLRPTGTRMVVTSADPERRIVREINGAPAAREYARLLGKDPAQLNPLTFAAHPVVVRLGGIHHVRSIRQMLDNGDLVFFSAIGEGVVLTLADAEPMADHLERELSALADRERPVAILACDCILRRIEAEEKQLTSRVSSVLRNHRVFGFSTYGEQRDTLHVNQTMTGVAIYPPPSVAPP